MEDGRITNSFKYNTVVRYLNSGRERDVQMEHSPLEIKCPKRYVFFFLELKWINTKINSLN